MNDYSFSIIKDNTLIGEGYGLGNNALEALENAFKMGTVLLPTNEPVEVVAVSSSGLALTFEVNRV